MKLDNKNHSHEAIIGVQESHALRISDDSQAMIIDSLINLYSDPIGSVVRELTSNCIDAHRERDLKLAGQIPMDEGDDPNYLSNALTVSVRYTDNNPLLGLDANISFNDSGLGLSPQRVKDIYTVLGTSTKRNDNHQIGGFGLGCKSPWAYVDSFYVNTRYNGTEYYYLMHKGETVPSMDLVHTAETTEKNGTSVIIPLKSKHGVRHEVESFRNAIQNQLAFFTQVVYEGFENYGGAPSKMMVYENHEKYALVKSNKDIQILIGNVLYPLEDSHFYDMQHKGKDVNFHRDTIMKFKIGELDLVPSREAVRYTDKTIKKIIERKCEILNEFEEVVIKELDNITDLRKAYTFHRQLGRNNYYIPSLEDIDIIPYKARMCKVTDFTIDLSKWDLDIPGVTIANFIFAYNAFVIEKQYGRGSNYKLVAKSTAEDFLFNGKKTFPVYQVEDKFSARTNTAIFEDKSNLQSESYRTGAACFKWRTYANTNTSDWRQISYQFELKNTLGDVLPVDSEENLTKLEKIFAKIRTACEKHMTWDDLRIYEDVDTSHLVGVTSEEEETPEQRRKRLGKFHYKNLTGSNGQYTGYEMDAVDMMDPSKSRTVIYGFQDDLEDLKMAKLLAGVDFEIHRIAKGIEKHYARQIYVKDWMKYDETFMPAVDKFLNKYEEWKAVKTRPQHKFVLSLNKEIYKYRASRLEPSGNEELHPKVKQYNPDFKLSDETITKINWYNEWHDKMYVMENSIFNSYYSIKPDLIRFFVEYMEMNEIAHTVDFVETTFEGALERYIDHYTDKEISYLGSAVKSLFGYSVKDDLMEKVEDLPTYTEKVNYIVNNVLLDNWTKNNVIEYLFDRADICVKLVEAPVNQLALEL